MKISFQLPNETIILDVELIDNPAVKSWADHFLQRELPVVTKRSVDINQLTPLSWNTDARQKYSRMQELFNILNSIGFVFEYPHPASVNTVTRDYLNKSHRFFTQTQKYVNLNNREVPDHLTVTSYLQELNHLVHDLETFLKIEAAPLLSSDFKQNWKEIVLLHDTAYDDQNWWFMEDSYREYHTPEFANLILGPQILGKTLLQSFLDQDDPNNWDTSGHYSNNGYLILMNKPYRKEIYNSDVFKNWLIKHGVTPDQMYYDFPIGNVTNIQELDRLFDRVYSNRNNEFPAQYSL
jgi:hypothetical protein